MASTTRGLCWMASHLSKQLLRLFASGELEGTKVQAIANAAEKDGWTPGDGLGPRLAAAGNRGNCSGNVARDIVRAAKGAKLTTSVTQPYYFTFEAETFSIFLPHEILHDMVKTFGDADLFEHDTYLATLVREWAVHPDVNCEGGVGRVAVLGLHCDGVSYSSSIRAGVQKGIMVASMNVISSSNENVLRRRQPLFVLPKARLCKCGCQGYHTYQAFFKIIAWSMQHLSAGTSPTSRHDGTVWATREETVRIAGGMSIAKGALLQIRGDWDFYSEVFRFRTASQDRFCWMCDATALPGLNCYHDFSAGANHRGTMISHGDFLATCAEHRVNPPNIFECPGTELQHVAVDSMHSGDLGMFQDAFGSLLWLEVSHRPWNKNRKEGMLRLNNDLLSYYAANRDRGFSQVQLTEVQILGKNPPYPYLKAKAAQTRHLADFALAIAHRHRTGVGDRPPFRFRAAHRLAAKTADHLVHLVNTFEGLAVYHRSCAADPFNPDECKRGMYQFLQSMEALNRLWRDGLPLGEHRTQPFHLRPKGHMLQHMVEDKLSMWGSPIRSWCYRDEDYVGAIKRIALRTRHPRTIDIRVIEKLMILAGLDSSL